MECINCHEPVGAEVGEIPFRADSNAGEPETWCAQCFCWHRATLEPQRYQGAYTPRKCFQCKLTSVDCGRGVCNQCGSRNGVVLPPRPTAVGV